MSAKWLRSKAWDDQHIPKALWPVKMVVRAMSTISLAVVLLAMVIVYVTLASVPIGMLAQLPTWIIYGVIAVALLGIIAVVPAWLFWRSTPGLGRGLRFAGVLFLLAGLFLVTAWVWVTFLWPVLHYDPVSKRGLMLFADFCSRYRSTTLRRLPGMEMTELEFYAWWPLRVILITFVLNMITATVRRIEFTFKNLGVLTVHTGIVCISLGSIYYGALKQEGDTLLLAGEPAADGSPTPGPMQDRFYDSTDLSLYVGQQLGYEERPLANIPRYNDYNLGAFVGESAFESGRRSLPWTLGEDSLGTSRMLDLPIPATGANIVDPDLSFRALGFASYAETVQDWRRVDLSSMTSISPEFRPNPLRVLFLISDLPDDKGVVSDKPAFSFLLLPRTPANRISELGGMLAVEYTVGMSESRWQDLLTPLAPGVQHALVIELPGTDQSPGKRTVMPLDPASLPMKMAVGEFEVEARELLAQPPFPIITEGFRGATSSVAKVRVSKPGNPSFAPFTRYVYHRFSEINQDMLEELNAQGMPKRKAPDASIRIGYVDASKIQVYIDEQRVAEEAGSVVGTTRRTRALVRPPGGVPRVIDSIPEGGTIDHFVPKLSLKLGPAWEHAESAERPAPVAAAKQDRSLIGTHDKSLLGVEITSEKLKDAAGKPWKTVAWLPFTKYMGVGMGTERDVFLPDGRMLRLAFGRRQHALPGFRIRLNDFEMIAYDHRGSPRDYQSQLHVEPTAESNFTAFDHVTRLNAPLTAPFHWDDNRAWLSNVAGRLASGLDPNQYKFSQAGWDQAGWARTQQQADAGMIKRPWASFTILGVGNNPGIHIIALGGVLMGVGIPWAFYVKPYLVQREKRKIQAQLAAGTYVRPVRTPQTPSPASAGGEPAPARSYEAAK